MKGPGPKRTLNSKTKDSTAAPKTSSAWKGNSAGAKTTRAASSSGFPTARASLTGKRRMGGEKRRRTTDSEEVTMFVVSSRMPRTTAATRGKRMAVTAVVRRVTVAGRSEKTASRAAKRNMVLRVVPWGVSSRRGQGGSGAVVDMVRFRALCLAGTEREAQMRR